MEKKFFDELEGNLMEAGRLVRGERESKTVYFALSAGEIKAIRAGVEMSQSVFAEQFQLSLDTIKGWEQGKRKPDAAATNYLRLIKADAHHVLRMLAA